MNWITKTYSPADQGRYRTDRGRISIWSDAMSGDALNDGNTTVCLLDPCWPVLPGPRYRGVVRNHRDLKTGTLITTSAVMELKEGRITTRSGSVYELGHTFASEEEALAQTGLRLQMRKRPSPPLQVLDLESDDISAIIETFAHEPLPEGNR